MLWLRGWGLMVAVGRRHPPFSIDAMIHTVEESSPRLPTLLFRLLRHRRHHTSCLNNVTCGRTRRKACFGMEGVVHANVGHKVTPVNDGRTAICTIFLHTSM